MASTNQSSSWASLLSSSILSDVTVTVDSLGNDLESVNGQDSNANTVNAVEHNNTFHLHRFPLFARSEFFKRKCEEAMNICHVTFSLSLDILPGGNHTFKEIVDFCYGLSPNLTAENVIGIIAAADKLGMTEEYSANNLIKLCEDFLKAEVYSSWKSSLTLLENVKDTTLGVGISKDVFKNCQEVVLEYASVLNEEEPESIFFAVKALFRRLVALSCTALDGLLQGFRRKKLTFVRIGNYFAKKNYDMVLPATFLMPKDSSSSSSSSSSLSSSSSSSSASYSSSGNEDTTYNKRAILDCLVETLGLSNDEFKEGKPMPFQIAYVVTLLKHGTKLKSKYEIVLREFLSTKLDGCSLEDLQALELETVVSLITGYTDYVTPLEEGKMFRIGALVDNYILWAACHCEGFRLPDCQKLVEILPGSFRKDFDTLYDGIDAFLDKNPDVNGGDVLRLCDALDPFKLSQSKIGMAVQNSRIPWQQGFFKSLCLAQNKALDSQKNLISTLEAELKGLREDLKTKDNRMAGALRQLDIAVTKNSRVMFPLRMEVSTQVPCQFPVVSIAVVPDGTVWVGGDSLSCYKEDKCLWKAEPKYSEFEALSFNGDNLWAGCHNGKILLIKAFKVVEEVKGHELSVSALWATSENWCFSGGFDKRVTIWKWCGNHIIRGWTSVKGAGHKGPIHAVCVDAKGKLWSASGDGTIKCWERISSEPFSDWKCVKTLMDKHSGPVRALAIGKYLFSGGSDGAINCWTLGGDLVKKMLGHNDLIQALVIDEDEVLWSGSDDHTIRGWKGPWRDGKCIAILDTHTDWVWALAIDVNNKLWSGSNDKTVVMWKASE